MLHVIPNFRGDAPVMGHVWESMSWEEEKLGFVYMSDMYPTDNSFLSKV